jgi:hypothetical protein
MAAYNVLMVSEEKLKSYTSIHQSVSPDDLQPYVLQSQDLYLQNYLGATFYQQLQDQILAGSVTVDNRYLLDNYIGTLLCNYSMYHALPFLKFKIFNKSILAPNSETAPGISMEDLKFLQNEVRSVAESYTKMMQVFLWNNQNLYPAWTSPNPLDGVTPDRKTPYYGGLQTNSKWFNYKKLRNYPYGTGERPAWGGSGGSNGNGGEQCWGCGDWPAQ